MFTRERDMNARLTSSWIRRKMPGICLAMFLPVLPAVASQLDTLVTSDTANGCNSVGGPLQGTVSASLPFTLCQFDATLYGAGASAVAGYLSLGTSATGLWQSNLPGGGISASATAQSGDVITVGGGTPGDLGFLDFQFDINGTNSTIFTGANGSIGTSVGGSFTNLFACDFNPNLFPIAIGCPDPGVADVLYHFDANEYSHVPVQVVVPIHFDVPWGVSFDLYSATGAQIEPDLVVNFSGSSSFIDTAEITSVSVLDANLQPVANPTLIADSGTLYPLLGATPPGPQPSVPEPSGMALLVTGAGVVLAYGKRKNAWIRPRA